MNMNSRISFAVIVALGGIVLLSGCATVSRVDLVKNGTVSVEAVSSEKVNILWPIRLVRSCALSATRRWAAMRRGGPTGSFRVRRIWGRSILSLHPRRLCSSPEASIPNRKPALVATRM
ncbi:MAG: hypothetical protein KAR47_06605 [Planctomycetes bacterium]|nr:hypothetical protein [Planctomycetota bacterium]